MTQRRKFVRARAYGLGQLGPRSSRYGDDILRILSVIFSGRAEEAEVVTGTAIRSYLTGRVRVQSWPCWGAWVLLHGRCCPHQHRPMLRQNVKSHKRILNSIVRSISKLKKLYKPLLTIHL